MNSEFEQPIGALSEAEKALLIWLRAFPVGLQRRLVDLFSGRAEDVDDDMAEALQKFPHWVLSEASEQPPLVGFVSRAAVAKSDMN